MKNFGQHLTTKFPSLFRKDRATGQPYAPCGCGCPKGWQSIVEGLCIFIEAYCSKNEGVEVLIDQVKEKFGSLRFYYTGGNQKIHDAVSFVEFLSSTICEETGKIGTLRRCKHGWYRTLCEEEFKKKPKLSLEAKVARLYEARKARDEAKKVRQEKAAEFGECEFFGMHDGFNEYKPKCYFKKHGEWCPTCWAKKPSHDDYVRKVNIAAAALRSVLAEGKKISSNND